MVALMTRFYIFEEFSIDFQVSTTSIIVYIAKLRFTIYGLFFLNSTITFINMTPYSETSAPHFKSPMHQKGC